MASVTCAPAGDGAHDDDGSGNNPFVFGQQINRNNAQYKGGYIKLPRWIVNSPVANDLNAFRVLIQHNCDACFQDTESKLLGLTLRRGECDLTRTQVAQRTGLTYDQVRWAENRLEKHFCMIKITQHSRTNSTGSSRRKRRKTPRVVTVLHYDGYYSAHTSATTSHAGGSADTAQKKSHLLKNSNIKNSYSSRLGKEFDQ